MERVKTRDRLAGSLVTDGIGNDILKGSAVATGALAVGVIGAWALSCMIAAVIESGGPISLFRAWLGAVTGM